MRQIACAAAFAMAAGAAVADEVRPDWSGFRLGVYAGAARSADSMTVSIGGVEVGAIEDVAGSGATVGGLAGYDRRIGRAVLGIEAEAGLTSVGGEAVGAVMQFPARASLDYIWTAALRARAGVLATDRLLVFATAGVAGAWLEGGVEGPFGELSDAAARWGWTAGAGVEWAATEHVRLRLEYLHADLGQSDYAIEGATASTRSETDAVRAALIYAW